MRSRATLVCVSIAICTSHSSIQASDDPPFTALASSSYYGRFGFDEANDMVVDADGFVYIAGWSESYGATGFDGFLVKLSPDGSQVLYSTVLGGSGFDIATALAVDPAGGVVVVGHTTSTNFPMLNAFQSELRGDSDVWIAKLDATGTLLYSTYYGGSSFENGMAIAVGPTGAIYIAGSTGSADLPAATGFLQAYAGGFADAFVLKIRPDGTGPAYAAYLGGSGDEFVSGIAVDATDHAYIAGGTGSLDFPLAAALQPAYGGGFRDGFITKLSPDGAQLVFSTYLGGVDWDHAVGVAVDHADAIYLAGVTSSYDFPTRNAYQPYLLGAYSDAFVTKLTPNGGLSYSTFFGGDGYDVARKVVVDTEGNVQIAGETDSVMFPLVGAIQSDVHWIDAFYAKFSTDGQVLLRSTPLGGSGFDTAGGLGLSPSGDVWMSGRTDSADLPLVNAFQPYLAGSADAFVSRLTFTFTEPLPNSPPVAAAGDDQVVFTDGCATDVVLDGSLSTDPDGDDLQFTWSGDFGSASAAAPSTTIALLPGSYTFTLTVRDGRGGTATDTVNVTVIDNAAPHVGAVSATPGVLGPPNHKMVDVAVSVELTGVCDSGSTCRIVSVSSNEPVNGLGDGDTASDWEVTGALSLRVRAERGKEPQGRIYTITIECVDAAGNAMQRTVTVSVPKA